MKLTVLFDLDDTLLDNDMEKFLPLYLKALTDYIDTVPAEKLIRELMQATKRMVDQTLPVTTLEQTFDQHFYRGIGIPKDQIKERIEHFYRVVFPDLRRHTRPRPGAIRAVEYALAHGHQVIIATNPLFPRQATYHRLAWAGLPEDKYPFSLVSTYEDFHFSKSDLAYIPEILAQCGWPEQPIVLIGDSLEDDIVPAEKLGIPTLWLHSDTQTLTFDAHPLSARGDVENIVPWLEKIRFDHFDLNVDAPHVIIAILKATPAALETVFKRADLKLLSKLKDANQPTAYDILQELVVEESDYYLPTVKTYLNELNVCDTTIDLPTIIESRDISSHDVGSLLHNFILTRLALLNMIIDLPNEVYQKRLKSAFEDHPTLYNFLQKLAERDRQKIRLIHNQLHSID